MEETLNSRLSKAPQKGYFMEHNKLSLSLYWQGVSLYHKDPCPERGLNHSKVVIRKHRNDEKKEN